ncbi:Hypothetical protein NTJ_03998 [Nesidiocoris tenuis]|uniref:Uncharacterized protein n=1 Tax=Nesidiocoris tenuis TaxID=355587 RepID=A0ABN7AFX3_9HEMI|nr:Hypothetical protein NTJ_03998 [Nesidiocoris tenuis]
MLRSILMNVKNGGAVVPCHLLSFSHSRLSPSRSSNFSLITISSLLRGANPPLRRLKVEKAASKLKYTVDPRPHSSFNSQDEYEFLRGL